MEMEDIKVGIMVMVTKPIETELDGVERRKGSIGLVESPVFGGGGVWWWVTHKSGEQGRYRYCELSIIETKSLDII